MPAADSPCSCSVPCGRLGHNEGDAVWCQAVPAVEGLGQQGGWGGGSCAKWAWRNKPPCLGCRRHHPIRLHIQNASSKIQFLRHLRQPPSRFKLQVQGPVEHGSPCNSWAAPWEGGLRSDVRHRESMKHNTKTTQMFMEITEYVLKEELPT